MMGAASVANPPNGIVRSLAMFRVRKRETRAYTIFQHALPHSPSQSLWNDGCVPDREEFTVALLLTLLFVLQCHHFV